MKISLTRRSRGAAIIVVLMLISLLLVIGSGMLMEQRSRYRASVSEAKLSQAYALALAGLEDFRIKLERDTGFPPVADAAHNTFTYQETVQDGGVVVGAYQVRCDLRLRSTPWSILRVSSTGLVGNPAHPDCAHRLAGEFDLIPFLRSDSSQENPRAYRFVQVQSWAADP